MTLFSWYNSSQIICRGVSYRSETEQDFMGISVDVRGKRNLVDSLASYVQGELMEGENAYFCEEVGRKVRLAGIQRQRGFVIPWQRLSCLLQNGIS